VNHLGIRIAGRPRVEIESDKNIARKELPFHVAAAVARSRNDVRVMGIDHRLVEAIGDLAFGV
jgi:hypothetical protein